MKRSYIREILDCIDEDTISFAGGLPNENLFDLKGISKATTQVLKDPKSLQYSSSQGLIGLRRIIANIYSKEFDFPTHEDEIMITTGSQQAFDIILKIFSKDEILVQKPSYIGALNAFKSLGLAIKGFDEIEQLPHMLHSSNDLYLMSDYCNPTGKSYTQAQRVKIASILKQKGNILIEDGAYGLLNFDGKINQPISALYDNSFHLGSFSKILAPGLRVGWIRAKKEDIDKILVSKESMDLHTPTLNQMIIEHYLNNNNLSTHLQKIRNDYKNRMSLMKKCMRKYLHNFDFEEPSGGMFIYGEFKNMDTMELAKKCLTKKVAFVPAQVFYANDQSSTFARFNFSNSSYKQIVKGIKIIANIIEQNNHAILSKSIWFNIFQDAALTSKYKTVYL